MNDILKSAFETPDPTITTMGSGSPSRRTIRIATTPCGHRWKVDDRRATRERGAPTTPFGRDFASSCRRMAGRMSTITGGRTFLDGGCAMLAMAVGTWSGGLLHPIAIELRGRIDHVVSSDGITLIDSDGQFTPFGFLRKTFVLDDESRVRIMPGRWSGDGMIDLDQDVSDWIASRLRQDLPNPTDRPWRTVDGNEETS